TGKVEGLEKHGILQFRGIPYARADRFRPSQPVEGWTGVRDATAFGPIAPQNPSPLESMLGAQSEPGVEDCLVVNVYTPAADDAARPVMVWIHGGGFVAGSGHVAWYDGTNLARTGNVVVVTLNYRLGALGFLHLGHLDAALAGSGANGIRDQVNALRWVRDNIAAFGGDPGNVTIFGESAGGMSVGTLLGTPSATGLFRSAIAQSGAASNGHDSDVAEWVTDRFLAALSLSPATVDGLLALPVDEILRAQAAVQAEVEANGRAGEGPGVGQLAFQPVVDGTILPEPPLDAIRAGGAAGVDLVAGTTADEWNLFHVQARNSGALSDDQVRRRFARLVGDDRVDDALAVYRARRPHADPDGLFCAAMTDWVFRMPAIRLAEAQLPHAGRVSMYRFAYASTAFGGALGACHAIDLPFAFANLDRGGVDVFLGGVDDGARRLADRLSRAWMATARSGDPQHDDLAWPAYDLDRRATCVLDREPAVADDPDREIRELWDEVAPTQSPPRP
ncbi:MAG: carboxylesterase/lipase family protein, partial [Acidimicrobiales bacterium]